MTRDATRSRARAGFTLLEMVVVVAVLGIVAGLAGLAAGEGSEHALEMAEMQLRDAMGRAQALAISNRSPHAVMLDEASDRFAVLDANGQLVADPLTKLPWVTDFVRPNQPRRVEIEGVNFGPAGMAAIFDAQGVPLFGGTLTLRHMDLTRTLVLDAATGWLGEP